LGNAVKDFDAVKSGISKTQAICEKGQIPWKLTEDTSVRKESGHGSKEHCRSASATESEEGNGKCSKEEKRGVTAEDS